MPSPIKTLIVASILLMATATGAVALDDKAVGIKLADALDAGEQGDWPLALSLGRQTGDPVAVDIVEWSRLRDGSAEFAAYPKFLAKHPDWPGLKLLRLRGESVIIPHYTPTEVVKFFSQQPPQTGEGILRLAEAYQALGQTGNANKLVIKAWQEFSMAKKVRVELYKTFKQTLAKHHVARLDMLLWRGLDDQAEGLYTLVPENYVTLAKARLGLRARVRNVDALIEAVPASLKDDPGLAYERFLWRVRKGRYEDARDLMLERSVSAAKLGRPEMWSERRRAYARQEMRDGHNKRAYQLASRHFLTEGSDYADLEWLAGYIALRKLNDPKTALAHFNRFRDAVATPISYGRAGYWLGRTYEALGNKTAANAAYAFGASYQTSFYGQLAAEKIAEPPDPSLAGKVAPSDWRQGSFVNSSVFHAAILFHYADNGLRAEQFLSQLAETQDASGLQQLADLAMELGRPHIALRLSKQAAGMGYVLPATYFPLTDLAKIGKPLAAELAMSIARRESELDPQAISPAGARGLMQVMPSTARKMSRELGLDYSSDRLTTDWQYNARLGSAYLAKQLKDYNGSYLLAFAAYNAGPSRVKRWIERYGDPRRDKLDQIDWIEHIPFRETRNYVMRVMESVHVYRARIKGTTPRLEISKDLKRG